MKRFTQLLMAGLLLVPLAACDEEGNLVIPVTGTISGTVSAGGGVGNVTVTLSGPVSDSRTTAADGTFSFGSLPTGSYVVSISDIPAGLAFSTTSRAVTITEDNTAATADFNGSVISSGVIVANVRAGDNPVPGVTVTLSGAGTGQAVTDASGQARFEGLAAGSFTVAISNTPANTTFATTSQSVTLGVNESKVATFNGVVDSSILTVSVRARNTPVPGTTVTISGPEGGQQLTGANGETVFTGLKAGVYTITISNWPANTSFTTTQQVKTLAVGESAVAEFNGDRDLTATVAITSITTPGGANVNPAAVAGIINVNVLVSEEDDNAVAVRAFFGGELVGEQAFAAPAVEGEADAIGATFPVTFTFNTALFNTTTGVVQWKNKAQGLTIQLETAEGGATADIVSQTLTLANTDFLGIVATPEFQLIDAGGQLWNNGDMGLKAIPVIYTDAASAWPASVTFNLGGLTAFGAPFPPAIDPFGPAPLAPVPASVSSLTDVTPDGSGHFSVTFLNTVGLGAGIANVNTGWCPTAGTCGFGPFGAFPGGLLNVTWQTIGGQPGAPSTTFSFGELQFGTSQPNGYMLIDNESPLGGTFALTNSPLPGALTNNAISVTPPPGGEPAMTRNGYVNHSFVMSSIHAVPGNPGGDNPFGIPNISTGFGGIGVAPSSTRVYYLGSTSCSAAASTGGTGDTVLDILGAGHPNLETMTNDVVSASARVEDLFANRTCVTIVSNDAAGPDATIGIDGMTPDITGTDGDGTPDDPDEYTSVSRYNPMLGQSFSIRASDLGKGFSGFAGTRTVLRRKANGGVVASGGSTTVSQQANPVGGVLEDTNVVDPPQTGGAFVDAYYDFFATIYDRAVNTDTYTTDEFIVDGAAPNLFNPIIPIGPYSTGASLSYTITHIDNVDLRLFDFAFTWDATTGPAAVAAEPNAMALMHVPTFEIDPVSPFGSSTIVNSGSTTFSTTLIRSWEMLEGGSAAPSLPAPDGLTTVGFRPLSATLGGGALIPTTDVQWRVFDHSGPIGVTPGAPGVGAFFDTQTSAGQMLPAWVPSAGTSHATALGVNEAGFVNADSDFEVRGTTGVFVSPYSVVHYFVTYAADPGVYHYLGAASLQPGSPADTGAGTDGRIYTYESPTFPSGIAGIMVVAIDSAGDALFTGLPL